MTTTSMPPPKTLTTTAEPTTTTSTPPPKSPNSSEPETSVNSEQESQLNTDTRDGTTEEEKKKRNSNAAATYTIPEWSGAPVHVFSLEIIKDGAVIDQLHVNKKGAYMFGRVDLCDFVLDHPTISRFHAVLQFKSNGGAYLYDLGSTHGTFINKNQVKKKVYVDLHVGDVIRFGHSSRLYIFQGPPDLMPPEADLKRLKKAKARQEMKDMEASLLRAKIEASRADGISWGMGEDAVEENEDEVDEITWQNYKGQLTEKQEKTREKVIKRLEKIAHMKKEIDAIRAKDIAQGGLTQGQQTQIARNEQRMSQIMEELENLEETLNESIRESLGARSGRSSRGKKKGAMEDEEDDYTSDDDEFYDRTHKSVKHKSGENKSVETADSLLDKRDAILKQMEDKEKLLLDEDKAAEKPEVAEAGDALEAYMSAVSSQLVLDDKEKIRKELSTLQSELDRIIYLLRIADPTGEAAKKRESKEQIPKTIVTKTSASDEANRPSSENNQKLRPSSVKSQTIDPEGSLAKSVKDKANLGATSESDMKREPELATDTNENAATVYSAAKPQWLGAVEDLKKQEVSQEVPLNMQDQETDQFVDYKNRATILTSSDHSLEDVGLENAAPGLIIRKRKQVEKSNDNEAKESEETTGPELKAEDAVALLLKHSRGYHASDEEDRPLNEGVPLEKKGKKDRKKTKRVLGPERPSFPSDEPEWVPPEGQSGDGRTSLNDRLGY